MSNYIVYKKEPCSDCEGGKVWAGPERQGYCWCDKCNKRGHTLTEVDLIDVLRELGVFVGELSKQAQELDMGYSPNI